VIVMTEFIAPPRSRAELRTIAYQFRKKLDLDKKVYFPVVEVLEAMTYMLDDFCFEVVEDEDWGDLSHAYTDMRTGYIYIRRSVYDGACNGGGRDRMTITHELAHRILHYAQVYMLQRNFDHREIKPYMDPEWQAKCLAGEIMAPAHLLVGKAPIEIATLCGISFDAAAMQYNKSVRLYRGGGQVA